MSHYPRFRVLAREIIESGALAVRDDPVSETTLFFEIRRGSTAQQSINGQSTSTADEQRKSH